MIVDGDLIVTIRRITDNSLTTPITVSIQLSVFEYIDNIFSLIFKLQLSGIKVVVPYRVKIFAKFVIITLLRPIITKLLLSV